MSEIFTFSSLLLTATVAAFGIWKYVDTKKRELKWKKTEFLNEQLKYINNDSDITEVVHLFSGRHPELKLENLFLLEGEKIHYDMYRKLEKLLDHLHLIAYSVMDSKTITLDEVDHYCGWHLQQITFSPELTNWCKMNGFPKVIQLAILVLRK